MHIFRLAGTVLKSLSIRPATRRYPFVARIYTPRTRGHIDVDIDACIYCGICERRCPTQAISVDKLGHTWSIERLRCIQCGSCVELCPKKCLFMADSYTAPSAGSVYDSFTPAPAPVKPPDARVSGDL